jgi:histidinol-phosphatase (PHP family)
VEQYVEKAIENETRFFGFSEHAPMDFDPKYRMRYDQIPLYRSMIEEARDRYGDRIDILTGFEVDFLPGYMDERILRADVDYLIGSVHFLGEWGFDNPEFIGEYKNRDIDTIWQNYFDAIEAMAKSGYFDIVGHLDLIKVFKFMPKKDIRLIAKDALHAIKRADMVIELNMAGYRKPVKEPYPSALLMEEIRTLDIPITFSSDAHAPDQVGLFKEELITFARSFGYSKCATFKARQRQLINF